MHGNLSPWANPVVSRRRTPCGLGDGAAHVASHQHLIAELQAGRIQSVAFVVPSDARWTLPLYDLAITTARRGWQLGIPAATYWFVTPEPEPPAGLESEGITFIGSTYADVRGRRRPARPAGRTHRARSDRQPDETASCARLATICAVAA